MYCNTIYKSIIDMEELILLINILMKTKKVCK
nr:MAG TPA: hypothetical protein [Caudoviricetes sp.]